MKVLNGVVVALARLQRNAPAVTVGQGTVSEPSVPRLLMSSFVPAAVEKLDPTRVSGRLRVRLPKSLSLNVAKLALLMIHEPSPMAIFRRPSSPVPCVPAWDAEKRLLC